MIRNWRNIFRLKRFSFVLLNIDSAQEKLAFFARYKPEILQDGTFTVLTPEPFEVQNFTTADYLKKYALPLKNFMESSTQKILIADELIINAVVRPEKKLNLLRYFHKNEKKLVLVCPSIANEEYQALRRNVLILNQKDIYQILNVFASFKIIKEKIAHTYEPFKDAQKSFGHMLQERSEANNK